MSSLLCRNKEANGYRRDTLSLAREGSAFLNSLRVIADADPDFSKGRFLGSAGQGQGNQRDSLFFFAEPAPAAVFEITGFELSGRFEVSRVDEPETVGIVYPGIDLPRRFHDALAEQVDIDDGAVLAVFRRRIGRV